jgi:AraC-like DNA-binding protein
LRDALFAPANQRSGVSVLGRPSWPRRNRQAPRPVNLGLDNATSSSLRATCVQWLAQSFRVIAFVPAKVSRGIDMGRPENAALDSSTPSESQLDCLANSLIQLLEAVKQDLECDQQAAKASLAKASSILQLAVDRRSGPNGSGTSGLAGWQIARVRAFIDKNLDRNIHTTDLSAVARRSAAHFARSFKRTVGESPHAYVMRMRLEKACHLMITTSESLSQIALCVGFSDQSHLTKRFKQALGQSPSNWRRERQIFNSSNSHEPTRNDGNGHGWPERNDSKVRPRRNVFQQ